MPFAGDRRGGAGASAREWTAAASVIARMTDEYVMRTARHGNAIPP